VFGNVKNCKKDVDIQVSAIPGSADRPNYFLSILKERTEYLNAKILLK